MDSIKIQFTVEIPREYEKKRLHGDMGGKTRVQIVGESVAAFNEEMDKTLIGEQEPLILELETGVVVSWKVAPKTPAGTDHSYIQVVKELKELKERFKNQAVENINFLTDRNLIDSLDNLEDDFKPKTNDT